MHSGPIDQTRLRLEAERRALQKQLEAWAQQRSEQSAELRRLAESLEQRRAELEKQAEQLNAERQQLEFERQAAWRPAAWPRRTHAIDHAAMEPSPVDEAPRESSRPYVLVRPMRCDQQDPSVGWRSH